MADEEKRPDEEKSDEASEEKKTDEAASAGEASEEKPSEEAASADGASEEQSSEEAASADGASEEQSSEEAASADDASSKEKEAATLESEERTTLSSEEGAKADEKPSGQGTQGDLVEHTEQGSPTALEKKRAREETEGHAEQVADAHGHGPTGHGDDHFAHIMPMKILGGVLLALILLTILTVAVTALDLGSQGNFIVAMVIATVKAGLVMAYFMHLVWDSKFNVMAFLSSFLFVLLFLSMALLDRQEYQTSVDTFEVEAAQD